MKQNKKIAFSGPSGIGKTTLCKYLDSKGITHLSTSAGDILNRQQKDVLHKRYGYSQNGHRNVIKLSAEDPAFGLAFQEAVLTQRGFQIKNAVTPFVIDRSPLDNVVYMLTQVSSQLSEDVVNTFIQKAQEAWTELSEVIILKYSPDVPIVKDNGSRVPNIFFQRYVSAVFTDTYFRYFANLPGPRVLFIDYWNLEDRINSVELFLGM